MAAIILLASTACAGDAPQVFEGGVSLPIIYDADRFVLAPTAATQDTLTFFLDTGGGVNMLFASALARFGLVPDTVGSGENRVLMVAPPPMTEGLELPPWPPGPNGSLPLMVVDEPPEFLTDRSGFLGRTWFADRSWTFDYPGRRLFWYPDGLPNMPGAAQTALGFQADSIGQRTTHFPRMQAIIDGDTLDLLFDTGATLMLGDSALAELNDELPAVRGTSFIITTVIDRWLERHPDWRVIQNAERGLRLVQVPQVMIAGVTTGPVWFVERPDRNFTEYMSQWMDRPVVGALGGSAFRDLIVSVDYLRAILFLQRPGDVDQRARQR